MADTDPGPWIILTLEARRRLAWFAATSRADWDYEDTLQALTGCHEAGWPDERTCRETFRLLLLPDSAPGDLRQASRNPLRPVPPAGDGTLQRGLAAARHALETRENLTGDDDPAAGAA